MDKVQIYKTLFMDKKPKFMIERQSMPHVKSFEEIEAEKQRL